MSHAGIDLPLPRRARAVLAAHPRAAVAAAWLPVAAAAGEAAVLVPAAPVWAGAAAALATAGLLRWRLPDGRLVDAFGLVTP